MADHSRRSFVGMSGAGLSFVLAGGWRGAARVLAGAGASRVEASALFDAIDRGDGDGLFRLIPATPGWERARDEAGLSLFARAVLGGQDRIAAGLRDRGYRPDVHELALAGDWDGFNEAVERSPDEVLGHHPVGGTAMAAAARGGAGRDIWRVYAAGCGANGRPGGEAYPSPLRAALSFRDLPTAELTAAGLLANGADPNLPEPGGVTPLHVAARRGSDDMVEMLIRKGAELHAVDVNGNRAIDMARSHGHERVVEMLSGRERIDRDHSSSRRAYDVHGKAYRRPDLSGVGVREQGRVVGMSHFNLDELRKEVERRPDLVHALATTTEGTVEAGAHTGRRDIVEYLLSRGAPYALPTAVMLGDKARVRALLAEDRRRIHERGPHDFALLWYTAIGTGGVELASLLLDAGAEVERQHHLGTTALHFAAMAGDEALAALLIARGADVHRRGRKFSARGDTPLMLAESRDRAGVAKLLRAHGARE